MLGILALAIAPTAAAAQTPEPPPQPLGSSVLARVHATLTGAMRRAGSYSGAYVVDLATGRPVFAWRAEISRIPASVEKLYTTATALRLLGPDAQLQTSILGVGAPDAAGVFHGDLYLRGGGDPTFTSSTQPVRGATSVSALADALLARTAITRLDGSIIGDESFFDARRGDPASNYREDPDLGGALSGLALDRGRSDATDGSPATYAARRLAGVLRRDGVPVSGRSTAGLTPPGASVLASVSSPPLATLIRLTTLDSDNFFAETLLKDLGARLGGRGTTAAGANIVRTWLATLGIAPRIVDGSGLSRRDRTSPRQVVRLLSQAGRLLGGPVLRAALPIAGRTGTLSHRMRHTPADGRCEAKTGTLQGVSALAGWCGGRIAFAFLMNGVDITRARVLQDRMTEALAALG